MVEKETGHFQGCDREGLGREGRQVFFTGGLREKRNGPGGMEHNRGESRSFEGLRRIPFEKDDGGRLRGERGRRKRDREKQASERERERESQRVRV